MRFLSKLILYLILFIFLPQCSPTHSYPKDTLRLSLTSEPPTLDWNIATDNVSFQILNQIMEGLTQYDSQMRAVPAAAKSWDISPDGKTYTFHLDPNYRWSDGQALRAQDFYDSWIRLLKPQTAAEYAYFLFDIVGAQEFNQGKISDPQQVGLKVINDLTFEVRLKTAIVFFPAITTFMVTFPLRQDILDRHGDHWTDPDKMLTMGPYQVSLWQHEYKIELKKNTYYGGFPQASIPKIKIYFVEEASTALSLYQSGSLDTAIPPDIALTKLEKHPHFIRSPKLRGYYFGFNQKKKPFDSPLMRKALTHALDKTYLPAILQGGEKITSSWIPQGMFAYNPKQGLEFSQPKAQNYLKKYRKIHTGPLPKMTLSFNSDARNKKIAQWAAHQWKKHLGITVKLENQEWKTYLSSLKTDAPQIFRLGWGADYPDPDNFMNLFTSYSGNNHTRWKNTQFDQLVTLAAKEKNPTTRQRFYHKTQKILLEDDTVIIPLFNAQQNRLIHPRLKNFYLLPVDFVYFKKVSIND